MKKEHWQTLMEIGHCKPVDKPAVALIVDTPWIPDYLGISTVDYITIPEVWFKANMTVMNQFPEVIMLPGFWVEVGMAAEPSGYGCRASFAHNAPPSVHPVIQDIADLERLSPPNPQKDGLMPLVLSFYRNARRLVKAEGMDIKIIAARGPLALATHILGVTEFLIALKTEPEKTHKLLAMTSKTVKEWLTAQAEVLPETQGILVLDDIIGFLSREDYLEFAHPYFKDIFSLPVDLRLLHNDTDNPASYEFLSDLGVNIFNFTHLQTISSVRERTGPSVCLMGNVPPRDILALGTPEQCYASAGECLKENGGAPGLLISAGGGVSPGTKAENIRALLDAVRDFRK
jgi:uroporphyrinogen decarboxylase